MTYWGVSFLAVFLPLTIIIYNIVPQKHRWKVLLVASAAFFWSISSKLIVYLIFTTIIMHEFGLWFAVNQKEKEEKLQNCEKEQRKQIKQEYLKKQRRVLVFTSLIQIGILAVLKYSGFFASNINNLLSFLNIPIQIPISRFLIPIGISFYTLQAVSYMIDVYKEKIKPEANIFKLALFISFFPQIMEGPICRYSETAEQLYKGEKVTYHTLTFGLQRMLYGMMKKMVIADRLNPIVTNIFCDYAKYDGGIVAVGMILYTLQLYMDFSGTMDIVIGIAEIFGVKMPENFRQPFFSKTISEFWTRWHITLGAWFRDYIFYPVSLTDKCKKLTTKLRKKVGNFYGPLAASTIALFCVWICNGLWHGEAWNYIFFGMYHFTLILIGRVIEPLVKKVNDKLHINSNNFIYKGLQIIRTTILVFIGELFFRADGLSTGIVMFKEMITKFSFNLIKDGTILQLGIDKADFIIVAITVIIIFVISLLKEKKVNIRESIGNKNIVVRWTLYYALILMIIIFGAYGIGYIPVDPMYAQF